MLQEKQGPLVLTDDEARLSHYSEGHYLFSHTYEGHFYFRGCLRPDLFQTLLYCGHHYALEHCPVADGLRGQLDFVRSRFCGPAKVASIGEGRGELLSALYLLGVTAVAADPASGPMRLIPRTLARWTGACMTYDAGLDGFVAGTVSFLAVDGEALMKRSDVQFDTVVFAESFEHIPEPQGDDLIAAIRARKLRLIITNVFDMHPIDPDDTGWNHVRRVDDELFDRIADGGDVLFRRGSHLVVQYR